MAKFNFYLRDKQSLTETPIQFFISWDGKRLKYATGLSVIPKYWDTGTQFIKENKKNPELSSKNVKLSNLKAAARKVLIDFENANKRQPSEKELKKAIDKEMNDGEQTETDLNLIKYISKFIEQANSRSNEKTGKPIAKGTIDTYNQLKNNIETYIKMFNKNIEFEDIDLDFYHDFNKYLISQGLATNTIGKRIAILKTILRDATERGINRNYAYQSKRFKVTRERTENIYLNESEILKLYDLNLSKNKRLDNVRDQFIVGCWTGLRFSDLSRLTDKHIQGDYIEIETQKTREPVSIPLHPIVKEILKKHNGTMPRSLSNQKTNEYLKELGAMVETLSIRTSKKITKGGVEVSRNYKKYELLTTHTARRSFASNLFLDKVPAQTIMKITGHKTEKSFHQYIKITPQENANIIRLHWENKSKMKILKQI